MTFHSSLDIPAVTSDTFAVSAARPSVYRGMPKRIFDLTLVLLSLPVVLPLVVLMMLLVALDGYAPLYRQKRIGYKGRIFSIVKLRTMVPDADLRLEQHLATDPEARGEWDKLQKLRDDPRVTWLGRFLRKSSLDELPQLWNVLTGDMSLIGPRPIMVDQAAIYPGHSYYSLRPGITGSWQVSERNLSSFVERASFDEAYAKSISFRGDLAILGQTVAVVLRGTGC